MGYGHSPVPAVYWGYIPITILGAAIAPQSLWVIGTTVLVILLLVAYFYFTIHGKAMRACALDRTAARLMGIRVNATVMLSFGMSAALGAIAGIVLTPLTMN